MALVLVEGPLGVKLHKCYKCKTEKKFSEFHKNKTKKNGLSNVCKTCKKTLGKSHYRENKEKYSEWSRSWRENNPSYMKKYLSEHYRSNKYLYFAYSAKRRAYKSDATPSWLTDTHLSEIKNFYWLAKDLTGVSGETYHVDHIVPLKGENVCGLHVPWNLQVLPADINLSKGNKYANDA